MYRSGASIAYTRLGRSDIGLTTRRTSVFLRIDSTKS